MEVRATTNLGLRKIADTALLQRFEYICNLGEGAYGEVWKCLDKESQKYVAMKRFKEVGDAMSRLAMAHHG